MKNEELMAKNNNLQHESSPTIATGEDPLSSNYFTRDGNHSRSPFVMNDENDSSNNDDGYETAISQHTPRLPLPLSILYGMYGLTMSLPMLPMMYILNTRVALPLSVLPTYGALSFMPYSFKPLYAYVSSFFPRHLLLCIGWACCALATLGWTWVPSVTWVFVLGIVHGVVMAWSGFLLGLTLLETAQCHLLKQNSIDIDSANHGGAAFETAASLFQSQAATARNIGSFLASILTLLIFGIGQRDQSQWSGLLVNGIFWATAGCHLISFFVVLGHRDTFSSDYSLRTSRTTPSSTVQATMQLPIRDDGRLTYSSLEVSEGYSDEDVSDADSEETLERQEQSSPTNKFNLFAVGFLQVSVILLALKGPIHTLVSDHLYILPVVAGVAIVGLLLLFLWLCIGNTGLRILKEARQGWGMSSMAGLVLILRHAVPSSFAVYNAFLYHCFQTQPAWLQIFSLAGSVTLTLASWSYQKLFAPHFSHGRKLIHFMMVTTFVTYASNNLFAVVVNTHRDDRSLEAQPLFPWLVLSIKVLTSFPMEWNFLPSVVLATVSIPGAENATRGVQNDTASNLRNMEMNEEDEQQGTPAESVPTTVPTVSSATNVAYGSLISCIDFGDQIGAILSTPIVSALGITRENNWRNLDSMIHICSGIGVLSAGVLTLLFFWLPRDPSCDPCRKPLLRF